MQYHYNVCMGIFGYYTHIMKINVLVYIRLQHSDHDSESICSLPFHKLNYE